MLELLPRRPLRATWLRQILSTTAVLPLSPLLIPRVVELVVAMLAPLGGLVPQWSPLLASPHEWSLRRDPLPMLPRPAGDRQQLPPSLRTPPRRPCLSAVGHAGVLSAVVQGGGVLAERPVLVSMAALLLASGAVSGERKGEEA